MRLFVGLAIATVVFLVVLWLVSRRWSRKAADIAQRAERTHDELSARMADMERDRSTREAVLSSMEEGVLLFDRDGSVVYQNDRARQLLGGQVDDTRGLAQPALRDLVAAAASGATPVPVEIYAGPTPRTILASARLVSDGQILTVLRDVTQARMIDAVRRDFVTNASHELKTPVASIQALAETLAAAAVSDPGEVPRFAAQLEGEAMRLSRIVTDLLDLSRLEGEAIHPGDVRLDQLMAEEVQRVRQRAETAGLAIETRLEQPLLVRGSASDLSLLARNLLENAIQYTRPGGTIEVSVRAEDGTALLTVRDTGIGIPAKDQGRIFERFYRVDRARSRETGGTGLGLSIVKHIVENHGGSVQVQSDLGVGSTFIVRLPTA